MKTLIVLALVLLALAGCSSDVTAPKAGKGLSQGGMTPAGRIVTAAAKGDSSETTTLGGIKAKWRETEDGGDDCPPDQPW